MSVRIEPVHLIGEIIKYVSNAFLLNIELFTLGDIIFNTTVLFDIYVEFSRKNHPILIAHYNSRA